MQGLLDGKLSFDGEGRLEGIFALNRYPCEQVFLFSGEHSDVLERVIKTLWQPEKDVCMQWQWSSMEDFIGEGATQDVRVKAFETKEDRNDAFITWLQEKEQT